MTDLLKEAREYLKKTEGITEGEWDITYDDGLYIRENTATTKTDDNAIDLTPTARRLIESFVLRINYLRATINVAKQKEPSEEQAYILAGLDMALRIMTAPEEKQNDQ